MKKFAFLFCAVAAVLFLAACESSPKGYSVVDGVIVFDAPARAEGQHSVLRLTTDPMPVGAGRIHRAGHARSGRRGAFHLPRRRRDQGALRPLSRPGRKVAGDPRRPESPRSRGLQRRGGLERALPSATTSTSSILCTPWQLHVPMAVYAMEHGKHVAVEVPAATSLEECWQLVNTAEKTQRHCMMLENCVYDFFELTTLNMARHGTVRRDHPRRRCVHPRPRSRSGSYYQGSWRLELQPVAPRRRLRHARPRSGLPAARHPPRRQDELPGGDGHRARSTGSKLAQREAGR